MSRNRLTRTQITNQLDSHEVAPSRALGQNFLCDPSMIDKIVRLSKAGSDDHVIEVGPGLGSLTLALAEIASQVSVVELDKHILALLEENITTAGLAEKVDIHNADVMQFNWAEVIDPTSSYKLIANLPYNIATPLVLDLLETQPAITTLFVMMQKEPALRLAAGPGSKTFGVPSVIASYWGEVTVAATVPPDVFFPKPKVESALVEIKRHDVTALGLDEYRTMTALVKAAFQKRRKMLRSGLAGHITSETFTQAGVDTTKRPEQLELEEWMSLARLASSSL